MKLHRLFACFLLLCLAFSACGTEAPLDPVIDPVPLAVQTYHYRNCDFLSSVPNDVAFGTDTKCTAMQGMAASEQYLYVAKQRDDRYANFYQYDVRTGNRRLMTYYPTMIADKEAAIDCVGHCNDMVVYDDGSRYLLAATARTRDSSPSLPCLTRFILNEETGSLRLCGFYDVVTRNEWGSKIPVAVGGIRMVTQTDTHHYFLIKDKDDFYWFKIPVGSAGGTRSNPEELDATLLFTIDNRNALFKNVFGEEFTAENLESWTNQGMGYHPAEDLLYIPLYNSSIGRGASHENVILTFRMEGMLKPEAMEAVTENRQKIIFPTNLSFYIDDPSGAFFEVESCVFLLNQGEDGDHRLFFNANGEDIHFAEGFWVMDYTAGSVDAQPIVSDDSIIYTVEYDYNVFATSKTQWKMDAPNYHFDMRTPTRHISGIQTNLRINTFVRKGYSFLGWKLFRQSDGSWLCSDGNWYPEEQIPAGIQAQILPDTAPVDALTEVNGDVITAFAQWVAPN